MSERSEYVPGEFAWVDVASPDPAAAVSFYGELLGWEAEEAGSEDEDAGGYGMFRKDGKLVAGYGPIQNEGQLPSWTSYVSVADADGTAAKAKAAGGTILAKPFDVFEAGRMAVIADPGGAVFSVWQPNRHQGAQLVNEVGTWTWNNLATDDLERAKEFYGALFGWGAELSAEAPPDSPYLMWQVEGQRWEEGLGGVMGIAEAGMPAGVPPHWQVYFAVESAEGTIETTRKAGGELLFGPVPIPVGKLAVLNDPQGANFCIIEPDYPDAR